jgi:hypothetical protein
VNSGGIGNVYDFENHLIQQGGATMVYDAPFASRTCLRGGDGNRVSKTVAGATTKFLIGEVNPTGYPQVVAENFSGGTGNREESHSYVYGLDRISQPRSYFIGPQSLPRQGAPKLTRLGTRRNARCASPKATAYADSCDRLPTKRGRP